MTDADTPVDPVETSFVVIAYNEEATIADCLQAIVSQEGLGKVEIIVVDDGSCDGTAAAVAEFAQRHPQVRLLQHGRNLGRGQSRRTGVRAALGEQVGMVDADIILPSAWLRQARQALANYDGVGGPPVPDGDVSYLARRFGLPPRVTPPTVTVTGSNGLYRRPVFDLVDYDAALREGEDVAANRAMESAGFQLVNIPSLACEHRSHKNFTQSLRWMYQSGIGATRQLLRYRQIRAPDLAVAGQIIAFAAAFLARRHARVILLPLTYLGLVAVVHTKSKFEVPTGQLLRVAATSGTDALLIAAYFLGRIAGVPQVSLPHRRPIGMG